MIIYGSRHLKGKYSGLSFISTCGKCEKERLFREREMSHWGHIYWIPILPMGKQAVLECDACQTQYVFDAKVSEAYANSKPNFTVVVSRDSDGIVPEALLECIMESTGWSEQEAVEFMKVNKEIRFNGKTLTAAYILIERLRAVCPNIRFISPKKIYSIPANERHFRISIHDLKNILDDLDAYREFKIITEWDEGKVRKFLNENDVAHFNNRTYQEAIKLADSFGLYGCTVSLWDEHVQAYVATEQENVAYNQGAILESLCRLCIAAASADGQVSTEEVRAITSFFSTVMNFNKNKLQIIGDMLKRAAAEPQDISQICSNVLYFCSMETAQLILKVVYEVVYADGRLTHEEKKVIDRIVMGLKIDETSHASIRMEFEEADEDLKWFAVLGISKGASRDAIRSAYRTLSMKCHPDKVTHMGPEFVKVAEERFKEINEAYSQLSKNVN